MEMSGSLGMAAVWNSVIGDGLVVNVNKGNAVGLTNHRIPPYFHMWETIDGLKAIHNEIYTHRNICANSTGYFNLSAFIDEVLIGSFQAPIDDDGVLISTILKRSFYDIFNFFDNFYVTNVTSTTGIFLPILGPIWKFSTPIYHLLDSIYKNLHGKFDANIIAKIFICVYINMNNETPPVSFNKSMQAYTNAENIIEITNKTIGCN